VNPQEILAAIKPYLKELVREILGEIIAQPSVPTGLLKPKDAIAHLGYSSQDELYDDITSGLLRPGREVFDRRRPGSTKARWVVDVAACKQRFAEDPQHRRSA
jgi:hypothetical protein